MSSVDAAVRRRLCLAREAAKLTQKEAAEEIGMSRQRLARCESGESSPSLEEFRSMCTVYGVTPSYVLFNASGLAPAIKRVMVRAARSAPAEGASS
jgi:transcriptional regulator with XRE-family HTH domain